MQIIAKYCNNVEHSAETGGAIFYFLFQYLYRLVCTSFCFLGELQALWET